MGDFVGVDPALLRQLANRLGDLAGTLAKDGALIKGTLDSFGSSANTALLATQSKQNGDDSSTLGKRADLAASLNDQPHYSNAGPWHIPGWDGTVYPPGYKGPVPKGAVAGDFVLTAWTITDSMSANEATTDIAELQKALQDPSAPGSQKVFADVANAMADNGDDPAFMQAFLGAGGLAEVQKVVQALRNPPNSPFLSSNAAAIAGLFGKGLNGAANLQAKGKITGFDPGKITDLWTLSTMLSSAGIPASQWQQSIIDRAAKLSLNIASPNDNGEANGGPSPDLPIDPALLQRILNVDRTGGVPPKQYATLLQQYWVSEAAQKAGLNLNAWDPTKGAGANAANINGVYTFYGNLFLDHPELQWAGMANMIGPSFAAGFMDLDGMKQLAHNMLGPIGSLPGPVQGALPPPLNAIAGISNMSASEFSFFENKFLGMQKHIFFDQAAMHEAYLNGGVPAIQEMYDAGLLGPKPDQGSVPNTADQTLQAWKDIASGNPNLVSKGNTALLYREQNVIITKQYLDMYHHDGPVGPAFTYMMTAIGSASIPGTKTPGQYKPWDIDVNVPEGPISEGVIVQTPLPAFNITDPQARWKYITDDTLPAYQKLLATDPAKANQIVSTPVQDRIDQQRILSRLPTLTEQLATDWSVKGLDVKVFGIPFDVTW